MTKIIRESNLDSFDKRILEIVQQDNQLTHAQIGTEVGLSSSAVRRRLGVLRSTGVIARDVSILAPSEANVRLIVTITFAKESIEAYQALEEQIKSAPEILQAYHVAGTEDYVLFVVGPSLQWYEDWSRQAFMSNPAIHRYDSRVVWSCTKFETAVPVEFR